MKIVRSFQSFSKFTSCVACVQNMTMKEGDMIRVRDIENFKSYSALQKSHLILSHGLDESLYLYWKVSVTQQSQALVVREKIMCFTAVEELKEMCTYKVIAPDTAMLKPFCKELFEKPFKEGLNFFKISVEIETKIGSITNWESVKCSRSFFNYSSMVTDDTLINYEYSVVNIWSP